MSQREIVTITYRLSQTRKDNPTNGCRNYYNHQIWY